MIDLSRKVVLLLGTINALTTGIVRRFAEAGAEVVIGCEPDSADEATILAAALTAMGRSPRPARTVALTPGDQAALASQVGSLDWIDIALISPGYHGAAPFMKTTPADWDESLSRNFEQATYAAQAAARKLIAQNNGGRIIVLSSIAALLPSARMIAAGTSLAALHALARMAAVDLGPHRITCNVVAVGWTDQALTPESSVYIRQGIPLDRLGAPADVGDVCCFLTSEQAAYITGATIPVDGGYALTQIDRSLDVPGELRWS